MPALARRAHRCCRRLARGRALRQARRRLRRRHAGRRSGRSDGRARARPVRRGRPRHRHVDRIRPRCRSPRAGGPARRRRRHYPRSHADPVGLQPWPRSTSGSGTSASTGSPTSTRSWSAGGSGSSSGYRSPRRQPPRTRSPRRRRRRCLRRCDRRGSAGGGRASRTTGRWTKTIAQNEQRKKTRLTLPVLAIGGARYSGAMVAETMLLAADDVTGVVLDDCGHYVAEERPARFTEILEDFLGGKPIAGGRHGPASIRWRRLSWRPREQGFGVVARTSGS